jgi:hypothetical protein
LLKGCHFQGPILVRRAGDWGKYLGAELRESNDVLHDGRELQSRLDEDGYLFVRNLRPRDVVNEARRAILERLRAAALLDRESWFRCENV